MEKFEPSKNEEFTFPTYKSRPFDFQLEFDEELKIRRRREIFETTMGQFIKSSIDHLAEKFPETKYRYGIDILDDVETGEESPLNIIEVLPRKIFNKNKDFHNEEKKIYLEFFALSPNVNMCFITDDSLVILEGQPVYEKQGALYKEEEKNDKNGLISRAVNMFRKKS